ncbi:MAG: Glycosyl hydrolase [Candidatus Moranbacteria bacterium GW2011_GWC2_37_8]|nr:MAG: Glycosyl hydrolase [Candidatus Moranbacteria bacterium GW2011_GWC2_37_8]KKQ62907.1 MAG: hypothetical protein US82_C0004G0024 [Parcubacteria group bacterium GW2011_GWC1_38_22]KKQ81463.1 MAG: Glycosyl hydrolase [Candidatus Moranbacteria bacterium GW2011_GWD2_38_7]
MNLVKEKNMNKRIFLALSLFGITFLLSGCSLPTSVLPVKNTIANATFLKSEDGGGVWNPKIKIDDKKNIAGVDVLTMAIHPIDQNIVYLGTAANGLFVTKDGGENWTQIAYADKAYGLLFDPRNPDIMYGSGIFNGRAKIFKRLAEGQEWKEIYTEPADGTTISSLAISNRNPQILYAGTSNGVIIKTTDGGQTWVNLKMENNSNAPIVNIGFDAASDAHVFFAVFQTGILETRNGGATLEDATKQIDKIGNVSSVFTLTTDPYFPGVVYAGTGNGIFRRNGDGSWNALNLIESSKAFPVRSIAVNPLNSREIMYSSAKAIYKSTDGGQKWSTFQLDTNKDISIIKYDVVNPARIYAGLRKF